MQVTIEIHSAYDDRANVVLDSIASTLDADSEDNIKQVMAREIRAQLLEPDFHFFASSGLHWHTGTDLLEVLTRQKKADTNRRSMYQAKGCTVYRVPGPETRKYTIGNYVPDVAGVTTVAVIDYAAKPPHK